MKLSHELSIDKSLAIKAGCRKNQVIPAEGSGAGNNGKVYEKSEMANDFWAKPQPVGSYCKMPHVTWIKLR